MKTTEELKDIVDRYMRKVGATWVFIPPPLDDFDNQNDNPDVYAMFLKINVLFHVYIKSREEYTDTWALRQVLNYDEQHTKCFDAKLGVSYIFWVITTADDFNKEEIKKEAKKRHVRLINGKEFANMLAEAGLEDTID